MTVVGCAPISIALFQIFALGVCVTARRESATPNPAYLEIRKLAIIAMFSDDVLMDRVVLKGGNAMNIVLGIGGRTSRDLDFSIEGDFEDVEDIRGRVTRAIEGRFDSAGYRVVDLTFKPQPAVRRAGMPVEWGGYKIDFKVIKKAAYEGYAGEPERLNTQMEDVGPGSQKVLTIEISHHEYTAGKIEAELDHHVVVVYTPAMIALEKLRAICQQMPEYGMRVHGAPRARDFYDIHHICEVDGVPLDTEQCGELLQHMFEAKVVPPELLDKIHEHREFHRLNWVQVIDAAKEPLKAEDFDRYFDFVLDLIPRLKIPRNE